MDPSTVNVLIALGGGAFLGFLGYLIRQPLLQLQRSIADLQQRMDTRITVLESWRSFHVEVTHHEESVRHAERRSTDDPSHDFRPLRGGEGG